jgi:hypothetical protein
MKHWKSLLLCSVLGAAAFNASACYTVYDRSNRVVYQGEAAPVDMSLPLHEALSAARYPGGHMVFDAAAACSSISTLAPLAPIARTASTGGTPLLTNSRTAQAMNVPYTPLAGGIALVQPGVMNARPGVTVVPAENAVAAANRDTVITEYRDANGGVLELVDRPGQGAAARAMGAGPAPRR